MANIYETEDSVAQYLHFHYGGGVGDKAAAFLPDQRGFDFAAQTVVRLLDIDEAADKTALDLGCAVGRSAFELSKHVRAVEASDLSSAFIDAASQVATGQTVSYRLAHDGGTVTDHAVTLPEGARPDRVNFAVGDALSAIGQYDIVHASNLLCRLPEPARFLQQAAALVRPGGQFALATPSSWLESYTARDQWPEVPILDFLREHLEPAFDLVREEDIPFVIREHDRKFQLGISLGSCWRRK